ncbi:MAG: hypothetical protein DRO01_04730 [Thermoproteota archaeon]|nr:MAG: hypothetical protein DRO01_04730 [Candidatus Korarchaeota archaeon]
MKKVLLFGIALLFLLSIHPRPVGAADWYGSDWDYRKKITIDHTKIENENFIDFPVLISITDSDLASDALDNGDDILFTASDGTTKLDHEIEKFDGSSGELVAWVRIPILYDNENTVIYMYYGNPSASNQESTEEVWDDNYVMVQHLEETSGTHFDSTSNNNDGTPNGGMYQGASGQINGADSFDGSNDYIDCGNGESLDTAEAVTIEAWIKIDTFSDWEGIVSRSGNDPFYQFTLDDSARLKWQHLIGGNILTVSANTSLNDGEWHYVVVRAVAGGDGTFFVDGEDDGTFSLSLSSLSTPDKKTYIGVERTLGKFFDGTIDEVRISNIARSSNYFYTVFNNESDPSSFYEVGSEEEAPPGPPGIPEIMFVTISDLKKIWDNTDWIDYGKAKLEWTIDENSLSYDIQIDNDKSFSSPLEVNTTENIYSTELPAGEYYARVRGVGIENGDWSEPFEFEIQVQAGTDLGGVALAIAVFIGLLITGLIWWEGEEEED